MFQFGDKLRNYLIILAIRLSADAAKPYPCRASTRIPVRYWWRYLILTCAGLATAMAIPAVGDSR